MPNVSKHHGRKIAPEGYHRVGQPLGPRLHNERFLLVIDENVPPVPSVGDFPTLSLSWAFTTSGDCIAKMRYAVALLTEKVEEAKRKAPERSPRQQAYLKGAERFFRDAERLLLDLIAVRGDQQFVENEHVLGQLLVRPVGVRPVKK